MNSIETMHCTPLLTVGNGRFLKVEQHIVRFPDGTTVDDWPWLITPEFINVVPVMEDGRFLCFRQVKYAADGLTYAVPGGYLEPGEAPLPAAQRELLEETGCIASQWHSLGSFVVDGNRGCGRGHFFLATGVRQQQASAADDLEELETLLLTQEELRQALLVGEFQVMPWTACLALALLALETMGKR